MYIYIAEGTLWGIRELEASRASRVTREIRETREIRNTMEMREMDHEKIEQGVRLILDGIGEDPMREGLWETPERIARMCEEIFGGLNENPADVLYKTFKAADNDMILEKDIPLYSVCEHHLMPFYGKAHIAYVPDGKVVGISKLARTVDILSRRPQIQEQLTDQIASAIMDNLKPKGVIVMIEAEHMCMTMRGIKKPGTKTVTIVRKGACEMYPEYEERFLRLVK